MKKQYTVSNPKTALKWALQSPNIHTAVLGITIFEQLETDLSVMGDLSLTEEEKKYLEMARLHQKDSLLCQGCGHCLEQCSSAPDIPALMRCYMYAYGYDDPVAAGRILETLGDSPITCMECSRCTVKCAQGFDIGNRIRDLVKWRNTLAPTIT
jgi:predicted aldo/keto reductase-like oxidoreductase